MVGAMLPALWVLLAALGAPGAARRHAPDLREDEPARRTTRPAECLFGKQAMELGSKWFADLGPPFGVMYCIKCECVAVQKKRRVVAKVHCRNIKNECPEPSCDTPVLLPGRCCKTCPGDVDSPDIVQEDSPMVITAEDEEHNFKNFASFLTGRSPLCVRRDDMSGVPVAPGVATARFTFRRRHLFWSVILSPSISTQPRSLAFLDKAGRLLLEQPLKKIPGIHATYEEKTDKLCGVWRRVPRQYKSLLRDGDLHVALLWGDERNNSIDSALSGRIDRYPALKSEMFTTLLEPEHPPPSFGEGACRDYGAMDHEDGWWGGTAIVTAVAGATPSLYLALVFNGVFPKTSAASHLVKVQLTLPEKNQTIIDQVQRITKPDYHLNVLEVTTPVTAAELRSLARGRLLLTVEAVGAPERRIVGSVRQKATCEMFHSPLVAERAPASVSPEGLALLYIDKEGSLVYDIQIDNYGANDLKITLVEEQGKRHSQVEILDTRVGVLARPSARIFEPLYEERLSVHVGADSGPPILQGRLTSKLLPDAAGSGPSLLRRTSQARLPPTMAGLVWVSVDSLCGLYYEAVVIGGNNRGRSGWWLESSPDDEGRWLGPDEGWILEPHATELLAVRAGAAHLQLRSHDNATVLMRTRIPQINVPTSCLPSVPGMSDNELTAKFTPGPTEDHQDDNAIFRLNQGYCTQGDKAYKTGEIWTDTKTCSKCVCISGVPKCEPVQCPKINCITPLIMPNGQCCPICTNSTSVIWSENGSCELAGQKYPPGSSWHPYLVPGGYDTCVTCTCNFETRQIYCPRVRCPPLHCSEKEAYRVDKRACCRVCPEPRAKKPDEETPKDQGAPRTAEEILAEGGCKFPDGPLPNGKEVHPSIHSHGEQRCVTCRCKDGEVTCVRKRCSRAACQKRRRDACCACARHRRTRLASHFTAPLSAPPAAYTPHS